jgi:hypothetical protein
MTAKKPVKVFWYPAEEQGRKSPPAGPKYFAVFQPQSSEVAHEDWSVLLELLPQSGHKYCRDGMLSFVSEEAPFSSLRPGHTFYLFEGRWPVAEGVVLQENEADAFHEPADVKPRD